MKERNLARITLLLIGIIFLLSGLSVFTFDIVKILKSRFGSEHNLTREILFLVSIVVQLLHIWTGIRSILSAIKGKPVFGLTTTALITLITLCFYVILALYRGDVRGPITLVEFCLGFPLQILLMISVRYLHKHPLK